MWNIELLDPFELNKFKFTVRVPMAATYTDAEIAAFGLPVGIDNDGNIDKSNLIEWVTVYWPLDRIIDAYTSGYTVKLVNESDIEKIARILTKVIEKLEYAINTKDDELKETLINFMEAVLNVNREKLEESIKKSEKEIVKSIKNTTDETVFDLFRSTPFKINTGVKVEI